MDELVVLAIRIALQVFVGSLLYDAALVPHDVDFLAVAQHLGSSGNEESGAALDDLLDCFQDQVAVGFVQVAHNVI